MAFFVFFFLRQYLKTLWLCSSHSSYGSALIFSISKRSLIKNKIDASPNNVTYRQRRAAKPHTVMSQRTQGKSAPESIYHNLIYQVFNKLPQKTHSSYQPACKAHCCVQGREQELTAKKMWITCHFRDTFSGWRMQRLTEFNQH